MPGEPSRPCHQRVDQLAARVRWLDRYRRMLAISAAAIVAPILIFGWGTGHPMGVAGARPMEALEAQFGLAQYAPKPAETTPAEA